MDRVEELVKFQSDFSLLPQARYPEMPYGQWEHLMAASLDSRRLSVDLVCMMDVVGGPIWYATSPQTIAQAIELAGQLLAEATSFRNKAVHILATAGSTGEGELDARWCRYQCMVHEGISVN